MATGLRVLTAFILAQYLVKMVAGKDRRTERFLWQYLFTLLIAGTLALFTGAVVFGREFFVIVIIGFVSAGGTLLSWKAIAISQSRTALFTFWDDIIAMGLSYFILHEGRFITLPVGIGIALSFLSLALFVRYEWVHRVQKKEGGYAIPLKFYVYVLVYSILYGIAMFGQRFWSFQHLPILTFALAWYIGACAAAVLIRLFYKDKGGDQQTKKSFTVLDVLLHFMLALSTYASLVLASVAYLAPQVIVQPIFLVGEMIIPALMGLFIFHERKHFDLTEWFYFAIGFTGALLVASGFY